MYLHTYNYCTHTYCFMTSIAPNPSIFPETPSKLHTWSSAIGTSLVMRSLAQHGACSCRSRWPGRESALAPNRKYDWLTWLLVIIPLDLLE